MKKILSVLLVLALCAGLVGCSASGSSSSSSTASESSASSAEGESSTATESAKLKIAIVTSPSGVDDGSFNEDVYNGINAFIAQNPD